MLPGRVFSGNISIYPSVKFARASKIGLFASSICSFDNVSGLGVSRNSKVPVSSIFVVESDPTFGGSCLNSAIVALPFGC